MNRALTLAREIAGTTSPNPGVGAVIVRDGKIIAEGATEPPPGAHAEVVALRNAGEAARGATMYVTLEPCSHHGRTPPCTDAIIAADIAEVHYAIADPDPKVDGGGHTALEKAGIDTIAGEGADQAHRIHEAHVKHRTTGLPFVIAKYAASLDGRIAAASGDSRWVSGPETRKWAHRLRTRIDAILVGSSTVVVDDPLLTARPEGVEDAHQPLRIIVDTRGRTTPMASVFTGESKTLVCTAETAPPAWRSALQARGAEVMSFPLFGDRIDILEVLKELGRRDIVTLLVEGGGIILGSFFDRGLVDKLYAIIAPVIVGAAEARTAISGRGAYRMSEAMRVCDITVERLGEDILITGYPRAV